MFRGSLDRSITVLGNREYEQLFTTKIQGLENPGWQKVEIDVEPFLETARLLYEGPRVSERTAAIETFLRGHSESLHPVTRRIIEGGHTYKAVDTSMPSIDCRSRPASPKAYGMKLN
ncbi:MAG: hypothetical protein PF795_15380 [Kiritimatiellae bacterium]|jgi:allophanate hydrolase|nr:hypothetical protein [Kiritimatiellia bacterium]